MRSGVFFIDTICLKHTIEDTLAFLPYMKWRIVSFTHDKR